MAPVDLHVEIIWHIFILCYFFDGYGMQIL